MSSYQNLDDVVAQLQSAGLVLDSATNGNGGALAGGVYVESTRSVRCDTLDKPRKKSGAYRLHELHLNDGIWIAGSYWVDHGSASFKLELNKECAACGAVMPLKATTCTSCGSTKRAKARSMPQAELDAHKKRMAENAKEAARQAEGRQARASSWATAVWWAAKPCTPADHDYFARKGLDETGGARIYPGNEGVKLEGATDDDYRYLGQFAGALVLPMCDTGGKVYGVQFILSREKHKALIDKKESDKIIWPAGMDGVGKVLMIGSSPLGLALVAEGYATAISLHMATGLPVVVVWNAGQIGNALTLLRKRYKKTKFLIAADDDWLQSCNSCKKYTPVESETCAHCGQPHGKGNAGISNARAASLAIGETAWVAPKFSAARPATRKGPTDFNDLHAIESINAVRAQIETKLIDLGWMDAATPKRAVPPSLATQGEMSGGAGEGNIGPNGEDIGYITLETMMDSFRLILTTEDYFDHRMNRIWSHGALLKATPRGVVNSWGSMRERKYCMPEQVGFDPDNSQPEIICNLYDGWPTVPVQGNCESVKKLLKRLCSYEVEFADTLYEWVLNWLAYQIQHPGAKMSTALIVHGDQGGGKNMFFSRVIKPMFGKYGIEFGQNALEEKYNEWMSAKLYGNGNEVIASHESLYHMKGYLKNIITEPYIQIRAMHHSARQERNCLNMVFLSNELQPLNLEKGDRRFCVIWTPATPQKGDDGHAEFIELIKSVLAEIANGGSAAMHYELLHRELGDFNEGTAPPKTKARQDLIDISQDSKERFCTEWLNEDIEGLPCVPVPIEMLFRAYQAWCARGYARSPAPLPKLTASISKMRNVSKRQDRYMVGQSYKKATFVFPHGLIDPPPNRSRVQWLADCIDEFDAALTEYRSGFDKNA